MNAQTRYDYARMRRLGYGAASALRMARTSTRFGWLEDAGLVRLRVDPDDCPDVSWCEPDSRDDRQTAAMKKKDRRTIEREGLWGIIAEYRFDADDDRGWIVADSLWGIVGADLSDGYTADLRASAVKALRAAIRGRCRVCKGTGKRCPFDPPALRSGGSFSGFLLDS